MKIKHGVSLLAIILISFFTGCKPKDAEVQTKINDQLKESPELSGVTATVENNVATLTGMVPSESEKSNAGAIAKNVHGVDSVINNITTNTPPSPSTSLIKDDALMEETKLILKNYPGVTGSVSAGIITLTGTVETGKKSALLDTLRTLNPIDINDQVMEQ